MKTFYNSNGRLLVIIGMICQLGPLIACVSALLNIQRTVNRSGIGDPSLVADAFGKMLLYNLYGLLVGVIGLILFILALVVLRYRAEWFFWFLIVYGALLILAFPFTLFGIFFYVYCLTKRREFLRSTDVIPNAV